MSLPKPDHVSHLLCGALILLALLGMGDASAGEPEVPDLSKNAYVNWNQVSAPLGRFILVKKGNDVCAIRFTRFRRDHDAHPPTLFSSGEETFHAEYDWFHKSDGGARFVKGSFERGHGSLVDKPLYGIGRLAFQTGNICVECGPFNLRWGYPGLLAFRFRNPREDSGIEMAPTNWSKIEEVNLDDPRLVWYVHDESRQELYIPLEDLP